MLRALMVAVRAEEELQQEVLIVDDEPHLRRALTVILGNAGFVTRSVADAKAALAECVARPPDVVLLDLVLPDRDGPGLCAEIRRVCDRPIVVLSGLDSEHDKVEALQRGADDYVTKPFSSAELVARLRAVLRRSQAERRRVVSVGPVTIDLVRRRLRKNGQDVHLTRTEWRLLEELARVPGALVLHEDLLRRVWGECSRDQGHLLRVHVARLRAKLEEDPHEPRLLLNEPGLGYRLALE